MHGGEGLDDLDARSFVAVCCQSSEKFLQLSLPLA